MQKASAIAVVAEW